MGKEDFCLAPQPLAPARSRPHGRLGLGAVRVIGERVIGQILTVGHDSRRRNLTPKICAAFWSTVTIADTFSPASLPVISVAELKPEPLVSHRLAAANIPAPQPSKNRRRAADRAVVLYQRLMAPPPKQAPQASLRRASQQRPCHRIKRDLAGHRQRLRQPAHDSSDLGSG
jgi:hypothetical protein